MVTDKIVVLTTCDSEQQAERLARHLVEHRLAACVNIVLGPVQSIYRWKGKVQSAHEVLMVVKTTEKRLADLEKEVVHRHSYDVPELVVLPVTAGSREYLSWLEESVRPAEK